MSGRSANTRPLEGEGPELVPPRRFLRKLHHRIQALRDAESGTISSFRTRAEGPNRDWVLAYDRLLDDCDGLLDSLLGRNELPEEPWATNADRQYMGCPICGTVVTVKPKSKDARPWCAHEPNRTFRWTPDGDEWTQMVPVEVSQASVAPKANPEADNFA